jgi:protein SCO1/2
VSGFFLYNYLYGEDKTSTKPIQQPSAVSPAQPALKLGGDWTLIDTDSKPFSSSQLSGQYYLIYFGFTKCPDICPTTLHYLATVQKYLRSFPEAQDIPLKIVFVSVDPERDEPTVLKQYLGNFKADIIGVTGRSKDDEALRSCMKKFKIYANRVEAANGYNMDHTTMVYLLDGASRYIDHINPAQPEKDTALQLLAKIRHHMFSQGQLQSHLP